MIIAVDAMGGDYAPGKIVEGAIAYVRNHPDPATIFLVGNVTAIRAELAKYPLDSRRHIEVRDASTVVPMEAHASVAVKKGMRDSSSIGVCASLVKSGKADAMVSAGNSGATMAAAAFMIGLIEGIDRPAIGAVIPTANGGRALLLDAGANMDCSVEQLLRFALMGGAFAWGVLGIKNPRVGLLNIGEEGGKGNELVKAAYEQLSKMKGINFIGNVDARNIFNGEVDVIVCDGFAGNVTLKIAEGVAEFLLADLKQEVGKRLVYRAGGALMRPASRKTKAKLDYAEHGGAPLLGTECVCVVSHGRSNARAIETAIEAAVRAVNADLVGKITEGLAVQASQ